MARRKRKRRSRKKSVTYDSKETKTVLGLVTTLITLLFFIAVFVDPAGKNFFNEISRAFGATTIVWGLFFLNLTLSLFEANIPTAKKSSVIAQIIILITLPAYLSSGFESESAALVAATKGQAGGTFGHFMAYQFFADRLSLAQFSQLILGIVILMVTPLALSVSVTQVSEYISKFISWAAAAIRTLSKGGEKVVETATDIPEQVSRFGDFQRKITSTKESSSASKFDVGNDAPQVVAKAARNYEEEDFGVTVKETELGESGLAHAELTYPNWQLPPTTLLNPYRKSEAKDKDKERNVQIIERTLTSFNVDAKVVDAFIGPSIIQYALDLPLGVNVKKVSNLNENLALALGVPANAIRIEIIPGSTYLGIEVPRSKRDMVRIKELIEAPNFTKDGSYLPVPIGKGIDGNAIIDNIQKMPHLLIAGATGSGKSVLTNSFIVSLLMTKTPDELRLILVDPKQVELGDYNGIPHLLTPVITDMDKVVNALKWAVAEMERRYTTLASAQVRNIEGYNKKMGFSAMPYIVIVIDEMADMMMTANKVEAEGAIMRLTQKARAVGIHLILATQRPSVNVITGIIKANVPARIGMSVSSGTDSRVILDEIGAESLMGNGDLLYRPAGVKADRLQGSFVSQEEVLRVVNFIKSQVPEVEYLTSILDGGSDGSGASGLNAASDDELFEQALRTVVNFQKGSSSFLQRKLNVGFNRAARLLEDLERAGVVGPAKGSKPRDVLISDADSFLADISS